MLSDNHGDDLGNGFQETIPAGVKVDYFLNFPAPIGGATSFLVSLPSHEERQNLARFNNFRVTLLEESGRPAPPIAGSAPERIRLETGPLKVIEVNHVQESTNRPNFPMKLTSIELYRGDRMRWNLTFHNRSGRDLDFSLHLDHASLADEHGNYYGVLRDSKGTATNGAWQVRIPDGVRVDYYLEFPAPKSGAKVFKVDLCRMPYGGERPYAPFTIKLPD